MDSPTPISVYTAAARAFASLVASIPDDAWEQPGLGEWTVRDLVGHAGRALTTVEDYLDLPPTDGPVVPDAVTYYGFARTVDPAAIADRGRASGKALGDDPADVVALMVERVLAKVAAADPGTPVTLPHGASMALSAYLQTRSFELAVHSLDIARAVHLEVPPGLGPAVVASTILAGEIAANTGPAADVLLALTGRIALPAGSSVV